MIYVAAGSLLASGLLCFWISVSSLLRIDIEQSLVPPAPAEPKEDKEEKPKLTRLGRPIEEKRLN
jgi:hypothetical protein